MRTDVKNAPKNSRLINCLFVCWLVGVHGLWCESLVCSLHHFELRVDVAHQRFNACVRWLLRAVQHQGELLQCSSVLTRTLKNEMINCC